MKKTAIWGLMVLLVVLFSHFSSGASQAQNISSALENGTIKILFEGKDDGEQVNITITKLLKENFILIIPKGVTSFPFQDGKFSISLSKEIEIDMGNKNEAQLTVSQSGENRITRGSFSIEKGTDGLTISYKKGLTTIYSIK